MNADWLNIKSCACTTNGATLLLLTRYIAVSEKFELIKQTLFGNKELAS